MKIIIKTEVEITDKQFLLLCEALRRYTRFHPKEELTKAWTGLGSKTRYAPAYPELMVPVHGIRPRGTVWWKLTLKGAQIVGQWLRDGYTHEDIESVKLPKES